MQHINTLPNNDDAEKGLIGLTLVHRQIPFGARMLSTTDFYNPFHRIIWSAFLELEADAQEIDPLTAIEIVKRDMPDARVNELTNTAVGIPNTNEEVFVRAVRSASTRRFLIGRLASSIQALERGDKDVIPQLRREIGELEYADEIRSNFTPLSEILERDVKPALIDLCNGITHKISTGFPAIDRAIGGGLSLSDVLLVAGLPGGGKSALVLQIAANMAGAGLPVAFLSGEMSNKENGLRLLGQIAQYTNLNSVTHISQNDRDYLLAWLKNIKQFPLYFDSKTYDLRSLTASLRPLVESAGIKVLVIDYIQLLKYDRSSKHSRTERIAECSQEVKRIAMEYGIAVIEVAQFNREGAKSGKPGMHDLDGSSQLEKDTSLIFILDREEGTPSVTIRIAKGRNTGEATVVGRFNGWKLNFEF